jgi:hypothetical protein
MSEEKRCRIVLETVGGRRLIFAVESVLEYEILTQHVCSYFGKWVTVGSGDKQVLIRKDQIQYVVYVGADEAL